MSNLDRIFVVAVGIIASFSEQLFRAAVATLLLAIVYELVTNGREPNGG